MKKENSSIIHSLNSGTIDDTELIEGLVLDQKTSGYDGPKRVEKAKIGLIQFCISPPKTDVKSLFSPLFCVLKLNLNAFRWRITSLLMITLKWIVF